MVRLPRGPLVVLTTLACLVSTAAADGRPLPIPESRAVARIVVSPAHGDKTVKEITDPRVIQQLLAFLAARNDRWQRPFDTFPTPQWSIRLEGREGLLLMLWLGAGWLGGREGGGTADDNRLRPLLQADRIELIRLLGLTSP
jgi:hypothetical protein